VPADAAAPIEPTHALAALRMEGDALAGVLAAMTSADLDRPTRLGDWTVQQLVAHLVRGVDRLPTYVAAPEPPDTTTDWLDYWSRAAESDPRSISDRAKEFASSINGRPVLEVWRRTVTDALTVAEGTPRDRRLHTPFGGIRLDHYLPTRVLEVTVHGLDLRAALGLEEVATPYALEVTTAVLVGLLDGPVPADLDEDPVGFILAATGRRPHEDPRLPVLT
jgi:uncharacterized protein (TIGR03083 family)